MANLQFRTSVENTIVLGAVASVLVLAGIGWLALSTINTLVATDRWVAHTQEVIATLESGLAILTDAETKQRGYLLTGSDHFLTGSLPEPPSRRWLVGWVQNSPAYLADNPDAQKRLDQVEPLISQRLESLNNRIKMRQEQGLQASIAAMENQQGKRLMDQIWQNIQGMHAAELQLLAERQDMAGAGQRPPVPGHCPDRQFAGLCARPWGNFYDAARLAFADTGAAGSQGKPGPDGINTGLHTGDCFHFKAIWPDATCSSTGGSWEIARPFAQLKFAERRSSTYLKSELAETAR